MSTRAIATWNLGRSLETEGKDQEALRAYIASYKTDRPNVGRYLTINALYKKVNGSEDGLEAEVGPSPLDSTLARTRPAPAAAEPTPAAAQPAETVVEKPVESKPLPSRLPVAEPNARPIDARAAETKIDEVAIPEIKAPVETADTKAAEVKHEEVKLAEEKPLEVTRPDETAAELKSAPSETKPVSDPPTEAKLPEKPVEEKKDAPIEAAANAKPVDEKTAESKPAEAKQVEEKPAEVMPVEDRTVEEKLVEIRPEEKRAEEKPAQVRPIEEKPVEEKNEQRSPTPTDVIPVEVKKDPPLAAADKPADEPKPVLEDPRPLPEDAKQEEKKEIPAEPPAELPKTKKPATGGYAVFVNERPYGDRSTNALDASKPQVREPAPDTAVPRPEESKPVEQNAAVRPRLVAGMKPEEVEPARTTAKNDRPANANKLPRDPSRPLFEPIVIKVPAGGGDRPAKKENASEETSATAAAEPTAHDRVSVTERVKGCTVGVSQETVDISGADGTVALLVSVDEGVDISSLRGTSASDEIQVVREPRIAGIDDRIVYLLRSVTGKPGLYQVAFTVPCGRKTVNVRVR